MQKNQQKPLTSYVQWKGATLILIFFSVKEELTLGHKTEICQPFIYKPATSYENLSSVGNSRHFRWTRFIFFRSYLIPLFIVNDYC